MALIPPFFLDCVVAIGLANDKGEKKWIATGFLYGHFRRKLDKTNNEYHVYLISNRHVLENQKTVYLRFNPKDNSPARDYSLDIEQAKKDGVFKTHPDTNIDLAAVVIKPAVLRADGIQFDYFKSDQNIANNKTLQDIGISEGDSIYILGFPMGIVGVKRSFTIVRHGTVARIRDYLAGTSKEILMDCMIFPGNSGGPVITKPELVAIQGTKPNNSASLIGLIASYIPYRDVAVSKQTGMPRVIFEDNSGLASVVPIQYLTDLMHTIEPKPNPQIGESTKEPPE